MVHLPQLDSGGSKAVKKLLEFTVAVLVFAFSAALAQTNWNMHVAWPETNFHTQGTLKLAELVNEKTGGSLNITVNAGGSLGFQGQEVLGAVRDGTLPIAEDLMSNAQGNEPILGLTALPLLVGSYDEAWALYQAAKPAYEEVLARNNQMLLYTSPWPPSGMYTETALTAPSNLEGLKMRTYDANSAEFAKGLGAEGLAIPFSELYTALSTGLIDAVLTSSQSGVDASLWEVTNDFTRIDYAFPLNMATVNLDAFDALSEEEQAALLEAAAEVETIQWEASSGADDASVATLEENGITVSGEVTPELQTAMDAVAANLEASWLELAGDAGANVLGSYRQ